MNFFSAQSPRSLRLSGKFFLSINQPPRRRERGDCTEKSTYTLFGQSRLNSKLHHYGPCFVSDSLFGSPDLGSRDKELPPAESQSGSTRGDKSTARRSVDK